MWTFNNIPYFSRFSPEFAPAVSVPGIVLLLLHQRHHDNTPVRLSALGGARMRGRVQIQIRLQEVQWHTGNVR